MIHYFMCVFRKAISDFKALIKNKKLFIITCIILLCAVIIDSLGYFPADKGWNALIEMSVLMIVFTMFFLSMKKTIFVKLFYAFALFVDLSLIIISILAICSIISL